MVVRASKIAAKGVKVLPRKAISRSLGWLADAEVPASALWPLLRGWALRADIALGDADVPADGYGSFNAFFTRRLRQKARPIAASDGDFASPSDGTLMEVGRVSPGSMMWVKGRLYSVSEMLGDGRGLPTRFHGGSYAVIYLAPPDYHRVHAAATGLVTAVRQVPGTLYPVNSIGDHVPNLLARNERTAVWQQTPNGFHTATVLVAAFGVGSVAVSVKPGSAVERGDELGTFRLGSTVVWLSERPVTFSRTVGSAVRMGEALGAWVS